MNRGNTENRCSVSVMRGTAALSPGTRTPWQTRCSEFSGSPAGARLGARLSARFIRGSLKQARAQEDIAASPSCSVASENIVEIFCIVFPMAQLEFLWGAQVNHYGNLGKTSRPPGVFLWSVGGGTGETRTPPQHPCTRSGFSSSRVFSLRTYKGSQQEDGSSDFLMWIKPHK